MPLEFGLSKVDKRDLEGKYMNVTEYLGFEGKGSIWIISWLHNQS